MPYQYIHRHCGGQVTVWRMRCKKCKKQWNPFSFMTTNAIRPVFVADPMKRKAAGAKWGEKLPVVNTIVGFLPNWPRWVRVLVVLAISGIIATIIWAVM